MEKTGVKQAITKLREKSDVRALGQLQVGWMVQEASLQKQGFPAACRAPPS